MKKVEEGSTLKGSPGIDCGSDPAGGLTLQSFKSARDGLSRWPHRLAIFLVCATFPLLFIGGLVTSKGVGLAVPDWPTTFGYNMFLYPWSKMVGGIFYEHSHRLIASGVGLLTIALAVVLWLRERRSWVRWLGMAALGLVIIQGVIGGLRVVWLEHDLAIIHACLAQAFVALAVALAVVTSAEWREGPVNKPLVDGSRLTRLCASTTALIYVQAVFGAMLRHRGEWLEAHLLFAALVSLHVILVIVRVTNVTPAQRNLTYPAAFLGLLLIAQLLLGVVSYVAKFTAMLRVPIDGLVVLTTSHLVVGALMLVISIVLTLRVFRYSSTSRPAVTQKVLTEQYS